MDNTIYNGTRDRHKEKPQEQNSSMLSNDQFLRARNVCASLTYTNVNMNINGKGEIIDCAIIKPLQGSLSSKCNFFRAIEFSLF